MYVLAGSILSLDRRSVDGETGIFCSAFPIFLLDVLIKSILEGLQVRRRSVGIQVEFRAAQQAENA